MRPQLLNAPLLPTAAVRVQLAAKTDARREQPKPLRELVSEELRQVSGGAPRRTW